MQLFTFSKTDSKIDSPRMRQSVNLGSAPLDQLAHKLPPLAMTIGNFDGVHLGHQAILQKLKNTAQAQALKTAVMFFEPQPKELFLGSKAPPRITSWREKVALMGEFGIDYVCIATFDSAFRTLSASAFSNQLSMLNVQSILVGDDFRFGLDRGGSGDFLAQQGFRVDKLDSVLLEDERISSTRIRQALTCGNFTEAQRLLGRAYSIWGRVEHGDKIGRTLNFPTANLALERPKPCLHGIYGAEVISLESQPIAAWSAHEKQLGIPGFTPHSLFAAVHVGTRPAIQDKPPEWRLEVHLPNFIGDLYDKRLKVTFLHFLHGEKSYPDLDALRLGIANDVDSLLSWRKTRL